MQCLLSLSGAILKFDEGNQNWQQQKVFSTIIKNTVVSYLHENQELEGKKWNKTILL